MLFLLYNRNRNITMLHLPLLLFHLLFVFHYSVEHNTTEDILRVQSSMNTPTTSTHDSSFTVLHSTCITIMIVIRYTPSTIIQNILPHLLIIHRSTYNNNDSHKVYSEYNHPWILLPHLLITHNSSFYMYNNNESHTAG